MLDVTSFQNVCLGKILPVVPHIWRSSRLDRSEANREIRLDGKVCFILQQVYFYRINYILSSILINWSNLLKHFKNPTYSFSLLRQDVFVEKYTMNKQMNIIQDRLIAQTPIKNSRTKFKSKFWFNWEYLDIRAELIQNI